jgi:hypothetical protein
VAVRPPVHHQRVFGSYRWFVESGWQLRSNGDTILAAMAKRLPIDPALVEEYAERLDDLCGAHAQSQGFRRFDYLALS